MARPSHTFVAVIGLLLATLVAKAADDVPHPGVAVDKEKRTVTIDAKVAPRKLSDPKFQGVVYPIEVIASWPYHAEPGKGGQKAHETVVTIDPSVKPSAVHKALESVGLKPGAPVKGESKEPPQGPDLNVYLEVPGADGMARRVPIEKALIDPKTNKPLPKVKWRFTGSVLSKPSAEKDATVYGADLTGTFIAVFPVTDQTVLQTNLTMKEEKYLKLETDKNVLPKEGTSVKLVLEVPAGK